MLIPRTGFLKTAPDTARDTAADAASDSACKSNYQDISYTNLLGNVGLLLLSNQTYKCMCRKVLKNTT